MNVKNELSLLNQLSREKYEIYHNNTVIGIIKTANNESVKNKDLIKTLCNWRNSNLDNFFDSNSSSFQSTKDWLTGIIRSKNRILFIIYNLENKPIAQYGIIKCSDTCVELDNGILGVRSGEKDLFKKIQAEILRICKLELKLKTAQAKVLTSNIPALFLHKQCGLKKVKTTTNSEKPFVTLTIKL